MIRFFLFFILSLPFFSWGDDQDLPKDYRPPILSTAAIIEIYDKDGKLEGIVLIERAKEPLGKALPGGKIEYDETVEHAVRRETKKDTNLDLYELRQFHVYSEPSRDPHWHTVEVIHLAKAYGKPQAKAFVVSLDQIPWEELTFDHAQILKDYISYRKDNKEIIMIMGMFALTSG